MMATTEVSEHTLAIPAFDPSGEQRLSLPDNGTELRGQVVAAFRADVEILRRAANMIDSNAVTAVHEYRKALRRARSVLEVIGGSLPKDMRRTMRRTLQAARRKVSAVRDHAVACDTLADLALGEVERATADAVLAKANDVAAPNAELKRLLAEGAADVVAQAEAFEATLPEQIKWRTLVTGVRATYAKARRARRAAKHSKRSFHAWRRRNKELFHQLELLAGLAGPGVAALHHEIDEALAPQGPVVDLLMVLDFVKTHGEGVAPDALDHLTRVIDTQLDDLMKDVRGAAREAFRRKPRRFARRLTKTIKLDLGHAGTPADPS